MNVTKIIWFVVLYLAVTFIVAPLLGVTEGLLVAVLAVTLSFILDYAGVIKATPTGIFGLKLKKQWKMILIIAMIGFLSLRLGWVDSFKGLIPSASVSGTIGTQQQSGVCEVTDELKGKSATLIPYAWDLESNTPYSSSVDFSTNCWMYANGNGPTDFVVTTTNTNDSTGEEGFTVGDVVYMYCGGTTYYGEALEDICVDEQKKTLNINAHTIVSESNMEITGYDDSGSTALTAGDTGDADYKMTMGADEESAMYVKLKVNVANKAYQVCAWGTAPFYNITSVEPQDVESSYTKVATPEHMSSISIGYNNSGANTINEDYVTYKFSSPILMQEWDAIKEQFVVKSSTSDPASTFATSTPEGFAILAKDCQYAKGDDGRVHLDFYAHDSGEADVGLAETETSPAGKQTGVLIEVE
jgi:hypothetical protein